MLIDRDVSPEPMLRRSSSRNASRGSPVSKLDVDPLQCLCQHFADERDWEQFHAPKNLAPALSVGAVELRQIFQWLDEAQSRPVRPGHPLHERVVAEIANVQIYLLHLADKVGVDLDAAVWRKAVRNDETYPPEYPPEKARGNARKYDGM